MSARQPLLESLRAAHLRLGLAAIVAAGVILTVLSLVTLRHHVQQNLTLIARSISYAAQAATVFGDAASAQEVLAPIAAREDLFAARLVDRDGQPLADYRSASERPVDSALVGVASWLFTAQASAPVTHEGRAYGSVVVQSDGVVYLMFLFKVLGGITLCTAATAWLVSRLSRRIEQEIVLPLNRLASLTRTARSERALGLRAPPAVVKEIHELGEDFNVLLAEIQAREAHLVASHDRLQTANESLSYRAFHDSLTGLPNRSAFLERAATVLQLHRGRGERAALLYIDCDRLKAINDGLGHAAGDELLVAVAERLRNSVRAGDVIGRLGGDEFAALLWPVRGRDDALRLAEKIGEAIRHPVHSITFGPLGTTASIGVALCEDSAIGVDALLAAADRAMYRAKTQRRGSIVVLDHISDEIARSSSVAA
jgi:diguanylate cyclase (GGDEF)-like protein